MGSPASRRAWIATLVVSLLVLFLALGTLNAFNVRLLDPQSPLQTVVYLALSTIAFLLFVSVLVALVRSLLKLFGDQRRGVLGSRLRSRMLWGAVLVSLVPLVFMLAFSYLLMNRAVDRWFSQPVTAMRDDAADLSAALERYANANARAEADTLAVDLAADPALAAERRSKPNRVADSVAASALTRILQRNELNLQGGFAVLFRGGSPIASLHVPSAAQGTDAGSPEEDRVTEQAALQVAQHGEGTLFHAGDFDYSVALAGLQDGGMVVVGLPLPAEVSVTNLRLRKATTAYWAIFRERRQVRSLYTGLLLLITLLALFACCWLALYTAKQVTRPVEALAEAMEALAAGDYGRRVEQGATEELGELAASFNAMAADLGSARGEAITSAARLLELNTALERRGTELETIIETIPTGLVTLSGTRHLVLANRALLEMLDPGGERAFVGLHLREVFPPEAVETLERLLQRSHRMGSASAELQLASPAGELHISAVVALLERGPAREHLGYVLVMEDVSEVLRAQKQSAWKEVARRVAHEIKNPLTPISLNAALIRRHMDRLAPALATEPSGRSVEVVQRATEVIGASVETMRSLVDQFGSLAEFPSARPRPADLNTIVESALALFTGRLDSICLQRRLGKSLPLVLADPEALKRAVGNLIDNAAEAMGESLLRELTVSTHLLENGAVELAVADTGPGLTDEMRERLFLPYFSTKQRGTGLGLSIAAKIVQEHGGTIRAEKNQPSGARFVVELRPALPLEDTAAALLASSPEMEVSIVPAAERVVA